MPVFLSAKYIQIPHDLRRFLAVIVMALRPLAHCPHNIRLREPIKNRKLFIFRYWNHIIILFFVLFLIAVCSAGALNPPADYAVILTRHFRVFFLANRQASFNSRI
jgi:hypothetical protein